MISEILKMIISELQMLLVGDCSVIYYSQFSSSERPPNILPCVIIRLEQGENCRQLIGGGQLMEYRIVFSVYDIHANASGNDDEGYSFDLLNLTDKVKNYFLKSGNYFLNTTQDLINKYSFTMTMEAVNRITPIGTEAGMIAGFDIIYKASMLDESIRNVKESDSKLKGIKIEWTE